MPKRNKSRKSCQEGFRRMCQLPDGNVVQSQDGKCPKYSSKVCASESYNPLDPPVNGFVHNSDYKSMNYYPNYPTNFNHNIHTEYPPVEHSQPNYCTQEQANKYFKCQKYAEISAIRLKFLQRVYDKAVFKLQNGVKPSDVNDYCEETLQKYEHYETSLLAAESIPNV